jgi:hypothetical protein
MSHASLTKFFSVAQITTRILHPQFCGFYFSAFFANKTGLFLNWFPLGIGIAQATAMRLRIGMNRCAVQPHKPTYEEN